MYIQQRNIMQNRGKVDSVGLGTRSYMKCPSRALGGLENLDHCNGKPLEGQTFVNLTVTVVLGMD